MHGNNPTRTYIETVFQQAAGEGLIAGWKRLTVNYGGAPKWRLTFHPSVTFTEPGSGIVDGTAEVRTYREGQLVAAALESARKALRKALASPSAALDTWMEKAMGGYTTDQLSEAFDRVKPRGNWKLPVDARLPADLTDEDRRCIDTAITFYTGGIATWQRDGDQGDWIVTAPGYYACIGS
jgi:hypothetical protein